MYTYRWPLQRRGFFMLTGQGLRDQCLLNRLFVVSLDTICNCKTHNIQTTGQTNYRDNDKKSINRELTVPYKQLSKWRTWKSGILSVRYVHVCMCVHACVRMRVCVDPVHVCIRAHVCVCDINQTRDLKKVPKLVRPDGRKESRTKVKIQHIHTTNNGKKCISLTQVKRLKRILKFLNLATDGSARIIQGVCARVWSVVITTSTRAFMYR